LKVPLTMALATEASHPPDSSSDSRICAAVRQSYSWRSNCVADPHPSDPRPQPSSPTTRSSARISKRSHGKQSRRL